MKQQRRNGHANGKRKLNGRRRANGSADLRVDLTDDEATILLDACRMYRHTLPVYLLSSKPDLQLINKVIRKLS